MSITGGVLLDNEPMSPLDQLRQRWENLNKDQNTKLRLSLNSLEHEQLSPVSAALSVIFSSHYVSLAIQMHIFRTVALWLVFLFMKVFLNI